MTRGLATTTTLLVMGLLAAPASAQTYNLILVAQEGDDIGGHTLTGFAFDPSLNNWGKIAFVGTTSSGSALFTPSGVVAQVGDTIGGAVLLTPVEASPSHNDQGAIAFRTRDGVFVSSGVAVLEQDVVGGMSLTEFIGIPFLNNLGEVAFRAQSTSDGGVFTQHRVLAVENTVVGGFPIGGIIGQPALNDAGKIIYCAQFPGNVGIFDSDSLLMATGDVISGLAVETIASSPSLNNRGQLAVRCVLSEPNGDLTGICTPEQVLVRTGQTIGGWTITDIPPFTPDLNDQSVVAFVATAEQGGNAVTALFTQHQRVVGAGDRVGGKVVASFLTKASLNDQGDIAARVEFEDGSTGIICAAANTISDFVRGDVNESGTLTLGDAIHMLGELAIGHPSTLCRDSADVDDNGEYNLDDPLHLLNYLYLEGPGIPGPFPECGADATNDAIDCAGYTTCI